MVLLRLSDLPQVGISLQGRFWVSQLHSSRLKPIIQPNKSKVGAVGSGSVSIRKQLALLNRDTLKEQQVLICLYMAQSTGTEYGVLEPFVIPPLPT